MMTDAHFEGELSMLMVCVHAAATYFAECSSPREGRLFAALTTQGDRVWVAYQQACNRRGGDCLMCRDRLTCPIATPTP